MHFPGFRIGEIWFWGLYYPLDGSIRAVHAPSSSYTLVWMYQSLDSLYTQLSLCQYSFLSLVVPPVSTLWYSTPFLMYPPPPISNCPKLLSSFASLIHPAFSSSTANSLASIAEMSGKSSFLAAPNLSNAKLSNHLVHVGWALEYRARKRSPESWRMMRMVIIIRGMCTF